MDVVLVLDQSDQCPSHADDVIVGVRTKAQCGFAFLARRMWFDGLHHPMKDLFGQLFRAALLPQQIVQVVVSEILVGEFQQRLAGLLAEPQRRSFGHLVGPLHVVQKPRCGDPFEVRSRRGINQGSDIGVFLEERGRETLGRRALERLGHDLGFVLTEGQEQNAASLKDAAQAHRQRLARHVVFTKEIAGDTSAGYRVERAKTCLAPPRRKRLIEPDVAVDPNSQEDQIEST